MSVAPTVLVLDDDVPFRERLGKALARRGFEVKLAGDKASAIALAREDSPEFALVDLRMPGESGLEVVAELTRLDSSSRIFMMTGFGSIATAVAAMKLGARGYLQKPLDAEDVVRAFSPEGVAPASGSDLPTLARAEWEYIQRALQDCGGNISLAARTLGIHRRSLQRKLQKSPPPR